MADQIISNIPKRSPERERDREERGDDIGTKVELRHRLRRMVDIFGVCMREKTILDSRPTEHL